jgi:hypothetical protein
VVPPLGMEEYSGWINLLEVPSELENIFVPSACLGEYRKRVLLGSIWPVVIVLTFALVLIGCELLLACRTANGSKRPGIRAVIMGGLQRVLPMMLGLTFLLLPSMSTRIFKTFPADRVCQRRDAALPLRGPGAFVRLSREGVPKRLQYGTLDALLVTGGDPHALRCAAMG